MASPTTQYLRRGDAHLAYQVVGNGDVDLLWVPGWFSHLEVAWEVPGLRTWLERLSGLGRLILYDKRGMGMSDAVPPDALPSFEERTEDLLALLDHVGSRRVVLIGVSEGGTQALVFAALHPERVQALVVVGAWARLVSTDGGLGVAPGMLERTMDRTRASWGSGASLGLIAPSVREDPLVQTAWATFERRAATPGAVLAYQRMCADIDARAHLGFVRAPTLVVHATEDRLVPVAQGRHIATRVTGAEYLEVPGPDHAVFLGAASDTVIARIEAFLTGRVTVASSPRRLATIVVVDIVGSTERALRDGTGRWGERVDAVDAAARATVDDHGGRAVRSTGDGLLVEFADPSVAITASAALHRVVTDTGLQLRVGVHAGMVEDHAGDLAGVAVHIAARIADLAPAGGTAVTSTVHDLLLGTSHRFDPGTDHELRGLPGTWTVHVLR